VFRPATLEPGHVTDVKRYASRELGFMPTSALTVDTICRSTDRQHSPCVCVHIRQSHQFCTNSVLTIYLLTYLQITIIAILAIVVEAQNCRW